MDGPRRYKQMAPPVPKGKWAWKYDRCIRCRRKDRRHEGRGLCESCYAANRNRSPKRKIVTKKARLKWWATHGSTPEYNAYQRNWRKTSPNYRTQRERDVIKIRMRRAALTEFSGKGNQLRKYQGVQYRCPVCPDHIIRSPIKPQELEVDIYAFEVFKKAMEKLCRAKLHVRAEEPLIEERLFIT
jgi:hypothetical protein